MHHNTGQSLSLRVLRLGVNVSQRCVVSLEEIVLIAAEVHTTLFTFHGHFSLFKGVVLVQHTWVLSFLVLVSCVAHLTDVIFALTSHRPVVRSIQTWVVVVGFGAWSADWGLLHIVTLNQFMSQVSPEQQKITLHNISSLVINGVSFDDRHCTDWFL